MGYGNECNIFSFPIDYEASLIIALVFIEAWKKENPQWLSKDIIILFY
jgi:hypothetical protein